MQVKDIQVNEGKIDIELEIVKKEEPREFNKFGKTGSVCNAMAKDETGQIKLTLWNEEIDKIEDGNKVKITNGYCSEFQGEKQLTSGKFGKLEVL
jgi:replication factor A1